MAQKPHPMRGIRCYHCRHAFDVAQKAMTVSCPKCYKQLLVQDIVIEKTHSVRKLQTCGRISVGPRGHVIAQVVDAVEGLDVRGVVEGGAVRASHLHLAAKARFKGDCNVGRIDIEPGARIDGGLFTVPDGAIVKELAELPVPDVVVTRAGKQMIVVRRTDRAADGSKKSTRKPARKKATRKRA